MDAVRSSPLVFKGTFVLMGMSALAPLCVTANSNTLVNSSEYFRDAFAETPALASGFSSGLIAVFNATSVIFGVVAALSGSQGNINLARRSLHALLLLCVAIAMGLVSVIIRPTGSVDKPYLYYLLLLLFSAVLALGMAVFQSATMALCVQIDRNGDLVSLVLTGQAVQGVASSLAALVGVLSASSPTTVSKSENQRAAVVLFSSTLALLVVTYGLMRSHLRVEHHAGAVKAHTITDALHRIWQVQQQLWVYSAAVLLIFGLTLTVYPSLTSLVRPTSGMQTSVFVALQYVAFNVGDLTGRRIAATSRFFHMGKRTVLIFALLRLAFIPLLCSANAVRSNGTALRCRVCAGTLPDAAFIAAVFALGLTTGWGAACTMVDGPKSVSHRVGDDVGAADDEAEAEGLLDTPAAQTDEDASIAAMLLTLQLVTGLTLGSLSSLSLVM